MKLINNLCYGIGVFFICICFVIVWFLCMGATIIRYFIAKYKRKPIDERVRMEMERIDKADWKGLRGHCDWGKGE